MSCMVHSNFKHTIGFTSLTALTRMLCRETLQPYHQWILGWGTRLIPQTYFNPLFCSINCAGATIFFPSTAGSPIHQNATTRHRQTKSHFSLPGAGTQISPVTTGAKLCSWKIWSWNWAPSNSAYPPPPNFEPPRVGHWPRLRSLFNHDSGSAGACCDQQGTVATCLKVFKTWQKIRTSATSPKANFIQAFSFKNDTRNCDFSHTPSRARWLCEGWTKVAVLLPLNTDCSRCFRRNYPKEPASCWGHNKWICQVHIGQTSSVWALHKISII